MSMSTHVIGLVPVNEKWEEMAAVFYACEKAGIDVPKEVNEFFDYQRPDSTGVEIDIKDAVTEWKDDMRQGYEVNIAILPKNVTVVRFYNSW